MKVSHHKQKNTKKYIIIGIVAIILISSPFIYVYAFNGNLFGWKSNQKTNNPTQDVNNINYNPATKDQQDAGSQTKTGSSDTPTAPTVVPGSDKKEVQLIITSTNQTSTILQIRTQINTTDTTGTCTLTITGQKTIVKTAGVQAFASVSTCQGFDIPLSELSAGSWHASIDYSSATLHGSIAKDIVVK